MKSAHSLTAEWAKIEQLRTEGKVTGTYAMKMGRQAREQLASARKQMTQPPAPAAALVDHLLNDPAPDQARLYRTSQSLALIEKQLEAR